MIGMCMHVKHFHEQLTCVCVQVMRQFREGGYNTLVSTCVGEEGLDIGEVDLIVCFDAHKSPIRLAQRMGRTGRKRAGRIVMLVTEGKEEQASNKNCKTNLIQSCTLFIFFVVVADL